MTIIQVLKEAKKPVRKADIIEKTGLSDKTFNSVISQVMAQNKCVKSDGYSYWIHGKILH